jgi:hypothetical protein
VALGLLAWRAAAEGHWTGFAFACFTGVAALVGAIVFVGTRTALADIAASWSLRRPPRARTARAPHASLSHPEQTLVAASGGTA